jgi:uncharacterized protein (DUF1810 family)
MSRLNRFLEAQGNPIAGYEAALAEIRAGEKIGHWIWYVFPQIRGLGSSGHSRTFAIEGEGEAAEFLRHAELRSRYLTIATAALDQLNRGTPLRVLMGSEIDAQKLVSSLTLFGHVARKLGGVDRSDAYDAIVRVADGVLAKAAEQGYLPCAHTLQRLGRVE